MVNCFIRHTDFKFHSPFGISEGWVYRFFNDLYKHSRCKGRYHFNDNIYSCLQVSPCPSSENEKIARTASTHEKILEDKRTLK